MALIYGSDRVPGESMSEFLIRLGVETLEKRHDSAVRALVAQIHQMGEALERGAADEALTMYEEWKAD